jgi:GrpB-like predicted nucleotidyltransferase (UPF0157 family)
MYFKYIEKLKDNPELVLEYGKLKLGLNGKTEKEYKKQKNEFILKHKLY